jgi:hypothetical protein
VVIRKKEFVLGGGTVVSGRVVWAGMLGYGEKWLDYSSTSTQKKQFLSLFDAR